MLTFSLSLLLCFPSASLSSSIAHASGFMRFLFYNKMPFSSQHTFVFTLHTFLACFVSFIGFYPDFHTNILLLSIRICVILVITVHTFITFRFRFFRLHVSVIHCFLILYIAHVISFSFRFLFLNRNHFWKNELSWPLYHVFFVCFGGRVRIYHEGVIEKKVWKITVWHHYHILTQLNNDFFRALRWLLVLKLAFRSLWIHWGAISHNDVTLTEQWRH